MEDQETAQKSYTDAKMASRGLEVTGSFAKKMGHGRISHQFAFRVSLFNEFLLGLKLDFL